MNNRDEYLIEQYFSRQISPVEQQELEQRVSEDSELNASFRFQQLTAAALLKNERDKLKAVLQDVEKKDLKPPAIFIVWTRYRVAATIALLLVAGFIARQYLLEEKVVAAKLEIKFTPYPNEFATASTPASASLLDQASNAYQNGDYTTAATLFGQIEPQQPAYQFYRAVSLVGAQDYNAAIALLTPLSQSGSAEYAGPATYFLAEATWQMGNKELARQTATAYLQTQKKQREAIFREKAADIIKAYNSGGF